MYFETAFKHIGRFLAAAFVTYATLVIIVSSAWTVGEQHTFYFLMYSLNTGFHEAGHFLFWFIGSIVFGYEDFGKLLHYMGGTILQWGIPLIFVIYFLATRRFFAFAIMLFWFGQSLHDSVLYIADATAMELPLLGGESSGHDWNYILFDLGILHLDKEISMAVENLAHLFMIGSVVLSWFFLITKMKDEYLMYRWQKEQLTDAEQELQKK